VSDELHASATLYLGNCPGTRGIGYYVDTIAVLESLVKTEMSVLLLGIQFR